MREFEGTIKPKILYRLYPMQFYWAYPACILFLFIAIVYGHPYVDKKVAETPLTYSQFLRMLLYVSISSALTSIVFTTYSDNIHMFICTVFNLPFERTKENVEVYTGEPAF
jgi:hypothetical protein